MKRVLYLILALVLCLSFAACTGDNTITNETESITAMESIGTPTTVPTTAPTTTPTTVPTTAPTTVPTTVPTTAPTSAPTAAPTTAPTTAPTKPTETVHVHSWQDATYTSPKICSICKATEGDPIVKPGSENYHGHVYTGGEYSKKFHYESNCAGKNSHEITWDEVQRRNLGPCGTCVLK